MSHGNFNTALQHLSVLLDRAVDLKSQDWLKAQDPYCKIRCANREEKSITIKGGGRNPIWNQTFSFQVGPNESELRVEIWDADNWTSDDLVGTATIPLAKVRQVGKTRMQVPVFTQKRKHHGHLIVDLELKQPTQPQLACASAGCGAYPQYHSQPHATLVAAAGAAAAAVHQYPAACSQAHRPHQPHQGQYSHTQAHQAQHNTGWVDYQRVNSMAGSYRTFDLGDAATLEELQAQLARVTSKRDRTHHQLLHNYRILQQYANTHDAAGRRWYNDLLVQYEHTNRELQGLNQEVYNLEQRIQYKMAMPAQPQPQPQAPYHPLSNASSHSSLDSLPGGNSAQLSYSTPAHTSTSNSHASHAHNAHTFGQSGLPSSNPHGHQPMDGSGLIHTHSMAMSSNETPGNAPGHHYVTTSSTAALLHTNGSEPGEGSLVSSRLRPGAGPAAGTSAPPATSTSNPLATSFLSDPAAQQRMEARWRAIKRWKRFIKFVITLRQQHELASQSLGGKLLPAAPHAAASPPPPPPPPPPGKGPRLGRPTPGSKPPEAKPKTTAANGAATAGSTAGGTSGSSEVATETGDGKVQNINGVFRDPKFVDNARLVRVHGTNVQTDKAGRQGGWQPRPIDAVEVGMNMLEELKKRGGYQQKILDDVRTHAEMIRAQAAKVNADRSKNMNELCTVVDAVNAELDVLVDVPAVLKHFPEWPEKRFDTMMDAADLYRARLGNKIRALLEWKAPSAPQKAIMQTRMLVDDTRRYLDKVAPDRASMEKRYSAEGLPWDSKIWDQLNMAALQLCAKQLRITLQATKQPSQLDHKQCVDLLQDTIDMHFRVYQMVGGHTAELQELYQEAMEVWQQLTKGGEAAAQ